MRHIPEDELHAYLDQALSRSQAVEIERHLSRCPRCQVERDAIAALRDRTTDILARLGSPPRIVPPPFAQLVARRNARRTERTRWLVRAGLAAGLGGALLAGHSGWRPVPAAPPVAAPILAQSAPVPNPEPARVASPRPSGPARTGVRPTVRLAATRESPTEGFANAVELDPETYFAAQGAEPPAAATIPGIDVPEVSAVPVGKQEPALTGLWRTITPDRGGAGVAGNVPLVPGFTVLRMRMQPGDDGAEVVAVDQQLDSGELIRTISGPAQRVAALVGPEGDRDASGRVTVTIRQADRMVAVTGPADALGSFLSRVNSRRRY